MRHLQARGDADVLIVQTAIAAAAHAETVLVGDDTDLLVLLIYHESNIAHNIYFRPEHKRGSEKASKCWNISEIRSLLGNVVVKNILFLHAILGCDTTSGVYGLGKKLSVNKIKSDTVFRDQSVVFNNSGTSKADIISAGEAALVCLYGGKLHQSINALRYEKFCTKSARSTTVVQPSSIPPTSAAAKFHSLRVYQQVQRWLGVELPPEDWGWKFSEGKLLPIMTDLQPAPQKFLEVVRCGCRSGCSSTRCSCKKHGMPCSSACSECRGVCANMLNDVESDEDEHES